MPPPAITSNKIIISQFLKVSFFIAAKPPEYDKSDFRYAEKSTFQENGYCKTSIALDILRIELSSIWRTRSLEML